MQYKLELKEDNPTLTYIRLLENPYNDMLILMGDAQLKNDKYGLISEPTEIVDFAYKVVEGEVLTESDTNELTLVISEVLCDLLNATMVEA